MTAQIAQQSGAEPYRGVASFRQEDSSIFFGREAEGELVAAKIIASRFTVLHAPSGAGKTSLLNAKIVPNLDAGGFSTVVVRLQEDPVDSVRTTVLLSVLPPPAAEAATIGEMLSLLEERDSTIEEQDSIGEALKAFDALKVWDLKRPKILGSQERSVTVPGSLTEVTGTVPSMFARLLRKTIELDRYICHMQAICRLATPPLTDADSFEASTPLRIFHELVTKPAFVEAYSSLFGRLYVPQPELTVFFQELSLVYGSQVPDFSVILIFDQFEELFTLFAPSLNIESESGAQRRKFKLRTDFLMQLRDLYCMGTNEPPELDRESGTAAPCQVKVPTLRLVLSMRDEYIAQLDPLRTFVKNWDESFYHLGLLNRKQAPEAILQPAIEFKYRYSAECLAEIVKDLTKDDNLIEPAHLQLVCERLWYAQGKQLSDESRRNSAIDELSEEGLPQVELSTFNALRRVQGILSTYLTNFLDGIQPKRSQLEALEMLQPLVTTSRTRNIVEMTILTQVPFRDISLREELLSRMVDAKIIRIERRLGSEFVEIVHEFLLTAVLTEIRTRLLSDGEHGRLLNALADLKTAAAKSDQSKLDERTFKALQSNHEEIKWNYDAVEVMARSAIQLGMKKDICRFWLQLLATIPRENETAFVEFLNKFSLDRDLLTIGDLDTALRLESMDPLKTEARMVVLRSLLHWSERSQRDGVRNWIQKIGLY